MRIDKAAPRGGARPARNPYPDAGSPRGGTSSPSVHPFQRTRTHVRSERSAVGPGVLVSAGSRKMVVPIRKIHKANLINRIGEEIVLWDPRSCVGDAFVGWPRASNDIVFEDPARGLGVKRGDSKAGAIPNDQIPSSVDDVIPDHEAGLKAISRFVREHQDVARVEHGIMLEGKVLDAVLEHHQDAIERARHYVEPEVLEEVIHEGDPGRLRIGGDVV